jgi:putative phage-type endonuclease
VGLNAAQAAARAGRIGASEVAALLGEHPYMTALDVYQRITEGRQQELNGPMRVGQYLEPHVLRMLRWEGLRARACHRAYTHPSLPLSASPDAYAAPHRGYGPGLVEVKVTYAWAEIPAYVRWQAQAQLLLTGRSVCWVAALTGSRLVTVPVEADWGAFRDILEAVELFHEEHLRPRIPPAQPAQPAVIFGAKPAPATPTQEELEPTHV